MADDEKGEDGEEIEVGKSGGTMGTILLTLLVSIVGAVGTIFVNDMFFSDADPAANDPAAQSGDASSSDQAVEVDTVMVDLGSFTVNLRDSSGRVLSMKIQLEIEKNEKNEADATKALPEIRDSILLLASDYSYTELEGIDGKIRLKDDIHARVNSVLEPVQAERVYFTEFVVQ